MSTVQRILAEKERGSVVTVSPEASVLEAARLMNHHRIGSVVVTIDGRLVGIIETGDYERFVAGASGADGTRHKQFMVNTVIFALTQEGSITNRVMDAIR